MPSLFKCREIIPLPHQTIFMNTIPKNAEFQEADIKSLPKEKQTTLGLYITSGEAYEMWQKEPINIKIIDVRTPEEFLFVGHPTMAWKIPIAAQTYIWDPEKGKYPMTVLPDFVSRVREIAEPDDVVMIMCRSGGRSAIAVNMLADAGFSQAYQIVDGMEGDIVDDPASLYKGQRMKNGWKNSGCPWTYKLNPDRMLLPKPDITEENK
jgi:rhodanese-related sulfurtransferase